MAEQITQNAKPSIPQMSIALVIGLCSHGLAMVRALHECGAEVHAFESKLDIPGAATTLAKIHRVESIKTDALIAHLIEFRELIPRSVPIVLFCTNDDNVAVVGRAIDQLHSLYEISWGDCAETVLSLLLKDSIEQQCRRANLDYPKSKTLSLPTDNEQVSNELSYPFIVKPIKPQSGFKVVKVNSEYELDAKVNRFQKDLPFLAQEWIDGGDETLFFCAFYLDRGAVIASFVGQKLASHPPAMGQTTVAVSCDNDEVVAAARQFFEGLKLSGPVSLELKRDDRGKLWVIEPTVGRTDFWIGLCVAGGCNFLQLEFEKGIGQPYSRQTQKTSIWFDSARDTQAVFRYLHFLLPWSINRRPPSYSYWNPEDQRPFWISTKKTLQRIGNKLARSFSRASKSPINAGHYQVRCFTDVNEIPESYQHLFPKAGEEALFLGRYWFSKMVEHIGKTTGQVSVYGIEDRESRPIALLPLWVKSQGLQKNSAVAVGQHIVSSMTNYYSPLFDAIYDVAHIERSAVFYLVLNEVLSSDRSIDALEFMPVHTNVKEGLEQAAEWLGLPALSYQSTTNYYLSRFSSYDDYRRSLPSKLLHTIQRKSNKIKQSSALEIVVSDGGEKVSEFLQEYHLVYQNSWKIDEPFPEFISELALYCADNGWLRVGVLRIDGLAVAAQIWFVIGKTACIYKLAYREDYKSFSPGTLLTDKLMQHVIDIDGVKKVDFLTGSDPYKGDWMNAERPMFNLVIPNTKRVTGLVIYLRHKLASIRDYLSRNFFNKV